MRKIICCVLIVLCFLILGACECQHSWIDADCINPLKCEECGITDGTPLEHSWITATCEQPKSCSRCGTQEGEPLGHTCSEWTIAKEPTLSNIGIEEILCNVCAKTIDSREISKKTPRVIGKKFNFSDDELISWANEWLNGAYVIENTMVHYDADAEISGYSVKSKNGEKGVLMLKHTESAEVSAIMVYFDNFADRAELAMLFGSKISKSFIYNNAAQALASDSVYCSANMIATNLTLGSMDVVLLSPEQYMYQLVAGTPLSPSDCYLSIEHNQPEYSKYDNNIWNMILGEYGSDYAYSFYIKDVTNFDLHGGLGEIKTYRGITLGVSTEMDIIDAYGRDMSFYFNEKTDAIYVVYANNDPAQWEFLKDTKKVLVYNYYGKFQIAFFIDTTGVVDCITYIGGMWYED